MREYQVKVNDGSIFKAAHIGLNHCANGKTYDGVISSYNRFFDDSDVVNMVDVKGDIRHGIIGDITEAYKILREEISSREPRHPMEYIKCIEKTIMLYFGYQSNSVKRLDHFPSDNNKKGKPIGKVSDLAHKNIAMSIERAMVAQNLLVDSSVETYFKISGVIINGKEDVHAYNIIKIDGKYYIFDATIPNISNYELNPIVCEIPEEVYLKMISPLSNIGYSVQVSHINPVNNQEYNIIYDAGREDIYQVDKTNNKKLVKHGKV